MADPETDNECTICKCDMASVRGYREGHNTEGLEMDCYRLSCGHAFHAHCIVQSLRYGNNLCPVCRNNGGSSGSRAANVTVTIHRNPVTNNIELGFGDGGADADGDMQLGAGAGNDDASISSNYLRYNEYELNPFIGRIRATHRPTQVARANLRRAVARYNVWRDGLRADRRRRLQAAISEFRSQRYREFKSRLEDVQQAYDTVQRIERIEYGTRVWEGERTALPEFDVGARDLVKEVGSDYGEYSTRRHDPCNRRFWTY